MACAEAEQAVAVAELGLSLRSGWKYVRTRGLRLPTDIRMAKFDSSTGGAACCVSPPHEVSKPPMPEKRIRRLLQDGLLRFHWALRYPAGSAAASAIG